MSQLSNGLSQLLAKLCTCPWTTEKIREQIISLSHTSYPSLFPREITRYLDRAALLWWPRELTFLPRLSRRQARQDTDSSALEWAVWPRLDFTQITELARLYLDKIQWFQGRKIYMLLYTYVITILKKPWVFQPAREMWASCSFQTLLRAHHRSYCCGALDATGIL